MFEFESNQKIMVLLVSVLRLFPEICRSGISGGPLWRCNGWQAIGSGGRSQVFPGPVASHRSSVELGSGRVTHVFHSAARVHLTEPFDMMRKAAKTLEHTG
jgi:hypothetical protein